MHKFKILGPFESAQELEDALNTLAENNNVVQLTPIIEGGSVTQMIVQYKPRYD
jgi:hypothetical protein